MEVFRKRCIELCFFIRQNMLHHFVSVGRFGLALGMKRNAPRIFGKTLHRAIYQNSTFPLCATALSL